MRRLTIAFAAVVAPMTLSWSALAAAQSAEPLTVTTLDARCVARAIAACVAQEQGPSSRLAGQTLPTVDYRSTAPCEAGVTRDADGNVVTVCDYNPAVQQNTAKLEACQSRVRADPPADCQSEVLTARGAEEMMREALRAQTAALREALYTQCLASGARVEDCDGVRGPSR